MTEQIPPSSAPPSFSLGDFIPKRSAGLKLLLVCGLAVLMIIPALLVHNIVYERSSGLESAIAEVSESVGGQQSVLGPFLAVPYSQTPDPSKPDKVVYGIAVAYAETGSVTSIVDVREKQRGIHTIPVFEAMMEFEASFDPAALRSAIPANAEAI
ncbi:MAG: inner membrane CreD family protein, partial [Pseudomonadota bacterium]